VVATQRLPWYLGVFSWLGVLIWFGGSSVALAASFRALPPDRTFLRVFGVFGMVLAVDDGFSLHEYTIPQLLGSNAELAIYALYGAVAVWIGVTWFRVLTPVARNFAIAAAVCLASSVLGDVVGAPSFVEDALKFIGVTAWAGLAVAQSDHAIPRATVGGDAHHGLG
jgi:hypothetical protein